MISLNSLQWLHIELSSNCQAACPLCARNDYGYKTRLDFPINEITLEQWSKIFDPVDLPNLRFILFNGNFGDPVMAKDILEIIEYCVNKWPYVNLRIITNGGIRSTSWWTNLANRFKKNLTLIFSIDGLEDTNHLYRVNVPYSKAMANARAFIDAGGIAHWKFIKFKHNEHQVENAKELSKKYGFKMFSLEEHGRNHGFVFTNDTEGYWIKPADDSISFDRPEAPEKFTVPNPVLTNNGYVEFLEERWRNNNKNISCVVKNEKTLYITSNSEVYPCCWIGHFPKQYKGWYTNFNEIFPNIKNNALEIGLEEAISWFNQVEETWKKESVADGILSTCLKCSKERRNIYKTIN